MKIPEDVKEEVRELRREGLTRWNIANYLGLSFAQVRLCVDKNYKESQKKSYIKNRIKRLAGMKLWKKNQKLIKNKKITKEIVKNIKRK